MVRQERGKKTTTPAARREHENSHEEMLLGQSRALVVVLEGDSGKRCGRRCVKKGISLSIRKKSKI